MAENIQTGPLQNLFNDIKKLIDFIEFKDVKLAKDNESTESKNESEMWMNAMVNKDSYITYREFWTLEMFKTVSNNVTSGQYKQYLAYPYSVPYIFQDYLREKGREKFFAHYEEKNNYYRMLTGLPPYGSTDFIYLSSELQQKYHVGNIPVHELSTYIQNQYIGTDEYKQVLEDNPDAGYLRYLGSYKMDLYTARNAKDFSIIRYPINNLDINPNLVKVFASTYADCREYVMVVLYNENFESVYEGYRDFMRFLILAYTLMHLGNKSLEQAISHHFLDDSLIHNILSMYGIDETMLTTKKIRRKLAANIYQLIQAKATTEVYYKLVDLLEYQDVVISKLMLMKGKSFDENGTVLESNEPYFLQLDITDDNIYDTIASGKAVKYSYKEITDADPTWWDLPDTRAIINNSNYSMTESKYITIEAVIHQMKYIFESIYFSRMVLDNKIDTETFMIDIPELFGKTMISLYDLILYMICATCMTAGLSGKITTESDEPLAIAGFNFDIDIESFREYVDSCKYIDKDRLMNFINNISMETYEDISKVFNDIMYPLREWLELELADTTNREAFREYENIYKALFTYDLTRNKFLDDFQMPLKNICDKYNISEEDIESFKYFYPRSLSGNAITVNDYNETSNSTRYSYPFLSNTNQVDWYIHIIIETDGHTDDRGYLYFHDILNSEDVRLLTNSDGTRIFMDYISEEEGWVINQQAVDQALKLIKQLEDDDLYNAYFQISIPNTNIHSNDKIPTSIQSIYKDILYDKVLMDCQGLSNPPDTYFEALRRTNLTLYDLLFKNDRFNYDRESWMNDVMSIITTIESKMSIHIKYYEQSVLGETLFFKPLVTLIERFKSTFVRIAKTGIKYIFDDKIDAGGNSNMLKFFDDPDVNMKMITSKSNQSIDIFGLYDTTNSTTYNIQINDRSEMIKQKEDGSISTKSKDISMGSLRMADEMMILKNGFPVDGNKFSWYSGDPELGHWNEEDYLIISQRNSKLSVDTEGWKDFTESYNG